MGKKSAIQKSAKGDLIPTPGPLDQQIEGASIAKARSADREKRKRKSEQKSDEYIPSTLSEKIILEAKKQLYDIDKEDGTGEVEDIKRYFLLQYVLLFMFCFLLTFLHFTD
ncbi:hypothetical protein ANCCAN_07910 [Ancylostoma caninum]|uniref:Uncharacterized protein n=1 Tax=Ancylostoma caninum TaxID=29170 RepID=A0A368GNY8_ANCCA|nr:hypothetical protein ANCCAN_07910 [Ancylostoma caninum]